MSTSGLTLGNLLWSDLYQPARSSVRDQGICVGSPIEEEVLGTEGANDEHARWLNLRGQEY
eukprot:1296210-Amorphochlora_amoeboformis.AAC.1